MTETNHSIEEAEKRTKFLIIRFSSIGDIVLTTPVVRCLKQQVPGAEVHFLTKREYAALLTANPYIDAVRVLGSSRELMLHELETEGYDYIVDLHHNLRTLRIKRALKTVPSFSFPKLNIEKWFLTALKINQLPAIHIVDRYLQTVASFGVVNDGKGLDYFIPHHIQLRAEDIPMSHQMGYIGLVIGAALGTKQMPVHKWKQLCEKISFPLILLGGPEDKKMGDAIVKSDPVKVYNACGKFSLHESALLVKQSSLIITHDTGLMHIAAAFRKPVISIWGNTVPTFGMGPYYGDAPVPQFVSEVNGLRCRPCSKIGYKDCPKKHFKCMEEQDLDAILAAVRSM
jgi:ADP-heptose:LPS heptosyltransferase